MTSCPNIYEHPEFLQYCDASQKRQQNEVKKLKKFLQNVNARAVGEELKHELSPFRSFPRGDNPIRCLFILCRDCNKELIKPICRFCNNDEHSMADAVLFFIGKHEDAYRKDGRKLILKYLSK